MQNPIRNLELVPKIQPQKRVGGRQSGKEIIIMNNATPATQGCFICELRIKVSFSLCLFYLETQRQSLFRKPERQDSPLDCQVVDLGVKIWLVMDMIMSHDSR